jgi:hypothetical protein
MDPQICANQIEDLHEQIAIIFIQTLAISTIIYKINSIWWPIYACRVDISIRIIFYESNFLIGYASESSNLLFDLSLESACCERKH